MDTVKSFILLALALTWLLAGCGGPGVVSQQPTATPTPIRSPIVPQAPEAVTVAVVTFLTGSAAEPFGIPARNGAQVIIDALNAGDAPPPYNTPGIGGVPVQVIYVDEAGGAEKQVQELRRLYADPQVDLVIGYISSGDCLAAAPVAEELKKLLVVFDCGTSRLFEERSYRYVFRTNAHQAIDSISGARYLLSERPDAWRVAGINQNYAWGQDSWAHFRDALYQLDSRIQIVSEQFPKLGAGDYAAELDMIQVSGAQVIHTSFWGQDLNALFTQANAQGTFESSNLLLSVGEYALPELGQRVPDGTMVGAHGPHGVLAPPGALNDWLNRIYRQQYGARPVYPVYHMAQALLGVKSAYEKAAQAAGVWPDQAQVIEAFEHLVYPSPSGEIQLALGQGHQAVEPAVYGTASGYDAKTGEVRLDKIVVYPAGCVNPPQGASTEQWIKDGFPGNDCP